MAHALVAMLQHAFVPLGVQHAGAAFKCHLVGQRADDAGATGLVADIYRHGAAALLFRRAADAAERVEVMIDGGDAELDRLEILVGEFDTRQDRGHQLGLLRHLAVAAMGEALALGEHLAELVFVFPAAAVDQHVDVGAIGAVGIGEDTQRGGLEVTGIGLHVGERMLPDEVLVFRLLGAGGEPAGLGEHARLQGQQVAEDAGEGEHHVDARAAQFGQRQQACAAQPAKAVEARCGTEQRHRLGDGSALALEVVGAPQHQRHGLGQGLAGGDMGVEQQLRLARTILHREGGRDAEGIEAMEVAPRRQDVGRADQVTARYGADEARIERLEQPCDLMVFRQEAVHLREVGGGSGFGDAGDGLAAGLGIHRLADDMQSVRDQRVFKFEDLQLQCVNLGFRIIPFGLSRGEVDGGGLGLDEEGEVMALGSSRLQPAPAADRGLEVDEAAVEARLGQRRRQVADERRTRAALGDGAFRRVVGGIEIEVREVADQPVRPAAGRHARLLAGHEFQRAVGAEV